MSLFPETSFGNANTTSGGRAYQIFNDGGWRPLTDHKEAEEQYSGAEAPLAGAVTPVIKAWGGVLPKGRCGYGVKNCGGVTPWATTPFRYQPGGCTANRITPTVPALKGHTP